MPSCRLHYDEAPELFRRGRLERIDRDPVRPLGCFSDLVVDELPMRIDAIRCLRPASRLRGLARLAAEMDESLRSVEDRDVASLADEELAAARVDAIYAYTAFVCAAELARLDPQHVHSAVVPERLHRLVAATSDLVAAPQVLTYADTVLANPVQLDPRLFTHGATGLAEHDFYTGHRYIEFLLERAIAALEAGLGGAAEELRQGLEEAAVPLGATCDIVRVFRDTMPERHFARYREFFAKNPVHRKLGPSGRFSARIAHVTILLVGDLIHEERPHFYRALFEFRELFPAEGFARLFRRIDRSFCPDVYPQADCDSGCRPSELSPPQRQPEVRTVHQAVRSHGSTKPLLDAFNHCKRMLDLFTSLHIATARKYTVDPGMSAVGIGDTETIDSVLHQRYLVGDRRARAPH